MMPALFADCIRVEYRICLPAMFTQHDLFVYADTTANQYVSGNISAKQEERASLGKLIMHYK